MRWRRMGLCRFTDRTATGPRGSGAGRVAVRCGSTTVRRSAERRGCCLPVRERAGSAGAARPRARRPVDGDRAPAAQRARRPRRHPRVLPRLRLRRAGGGDPRSLRAVHDPARRLGGPGRAVVHGPDAAHPGQPAGAGVRLPPGAARARSGRGGVRLPGGRDQLLLHRPSADARCRLAGPRDRRTPRPGRDLGVAAGLLRGRPRAAADRLDPRASGRPRLRRPAVRRAGG